MKKIKILLIYIELANPDSTKKLYALKIDLAKSTLENERNQVVSYMECSWSVVILIFLLMIMSISSSFYDDFIFWNLWLLLWLLFCSGALTHSVKALDISLKIDTELALQVGRRTKRAWSETASRWWSCKNLMEQEAIGQQINIRCV